MTIDQSTAGPRAGPWDQRLARVLVRRLARTRVSANQITTATLLLGLASAALFASGIGWASDLGAGVFALARFLDHFDGELARLKGQSSRFGYYFDYLAGGLSYAALFLGIGLGLQHGWLGGWSVVLGGAGAVSALLAVVLNLRLDKALRVDAAGGAVGYPAYAGVELEDGIYLIAPVTWLGWLDPFFVAAGVGATAYLLWTLARVLRLAWRRPAI